MGRHSIPGPGDSQNEPVEPDHRDVASAPDGVIPVRSSFDANAPGQQSSGHRNDGEWTGSHRVVASGRRGVSLGVIAALVGVVILVAGSIVWRFFGDALSDRSNIAGDRCLDGEAKVAVLADPAIADTVSEFAKKFNKSAGPIGDKCVAVSVTAADSDVVVDGLLGTWPETLGEKPSVWIPGSSVSSARLQAAAGAGLVSSARSVATSPVLLAVRPELKSALDQQTWATLPALQTGQAALDGLDLAGWGSLRLALPITGDSDASNLAAEAVAAASAPQGSPATAGLGAVGTLVAGQPKLDGNSLDTAMDALLKSSDAAAAPAHAVVTTEQQLFKRAASLSDAKDSIAGWTPPGPTAVADFPAVLLTGDWIAEEQVSGASEFDHYLHKPEQQTELSKAGFRTEGNTPPANDVTGFAPLAATLSIDDDAARVAISNALGTPATGPGQTTSIMLDRSLNLGAMVSALNTRIAALPPTSAVGLTTFDGVQSTTEVNTGGLADPVEGQSRSQAITATLNGLSPSGGGGVSFTTLRNIYAAAQANFRPGQPNSVLVITSGPHTDESLGSEGLQDLIRSSVDPARPVAVNVINVGDDPDRATWEAVAQISGGAYQNVPGSDSPEMIAALNTALS